MTDSTFLKRTKKHRRVRKSGADSASRILGTLTSGLELFLLTKAQFPLLDLLVAIARQIGAADWYLATWSTSAADISQLRRLRDRGAIRKMVFVIDDSFQAREPALLKELGDIFGFENVRQARSHAKICVLRNERWNVSVRSSANLNTNPRFEQFDVSDDRELAAALVEWFGWQKSFGAGIYGERMDAIRGYLEQPMNGAEAAELKRGKGKRKRKRAKPAGDPTAYLSPSIRKLLNGRRW